MDHKDSRAEREENGNMTELQGKELTPEIIRRAMACKSAGELLALAKENGVEITPEEAEAYLEELSNRELDPAELGKASGGREICYAVNGCASHNVFPD
jgi:hypothetical protein